MCFCLGEFLSCVGVAARTSIYISVGSALRRGMARLASVLRLLGQAEEPWLVVSAYDGVPVTCCERVSLDVSGP